MTTPYLVELTGDFTLLDASTPDLTLYLRMIVPWIEDNGMVVPTEIVILAPSGSIPLATYYMIMEPGDGAVFSVRIVRDSDGATLYAVNEDRSDPGGGSPSIDLRNVVDAIDVADLRGEFYYLSGAPFAGTLRVTLTDDWLRKTYPGGLIGVLPGVIDYTIATPTALDLEGATNAKPCVLTISAHTFEDGDIIAISGCRGMTQLNNRRFMVAHKATNTVQLRAEPVSITGATRANPCVVTAPGHTFIAGETVYIDKVEGMDDLNGNEYTVANPSGSTFELSGVDSSGYDPYVSGGEARAYVDSTAYGTWPAWAMTGATKANPCVITAPGHGLVAGENVDIAGVVGMTELNGHRYTVANPVGDTFELDGIDSSGYTTYVSGGTATPELDGAAVWTNMLGRTKISVPCTYNLEVLDDDGVSVWTKAGAAIDEDFTGGLVCTISDQITALNQS